MQPPISVGTILQNRYRLLGILGQGGFGRTYLAEDLGRFQERCALKEFIPIQAGAYALEKSKELFQREAEILYRINHPQIPQFRATFEENQRLFLVQDYVEGKTYRALLNDRKTQGYAFSEPDVLQLMRQLLPVLAHIHSKGIIHRDIAPDNIILRQQDQLPVLIDFGVVKELVTKMQSPETVHQSTTVGKLGYAPSEQMQTGRAYPSSDLYSLAVTVVVLLTGREPQELYDDVNLTWHWQRYATVSPGFAQILNRMLTYRPGDRYQSVSDVAQAIHNMINPAASPPTMAAAPTPAPPAPAQTAPAPPAPAQTAPAQTAPAAQPKNPDVSRVQTVAVGRRLESARQHDPRYPDPMIPTPREETVWDNPWAVVAIGTGLAIVTGIGSWAVVSALLNNSPTPTVSPTASPTVVATPTPTPSPSPTEPVEFSQRLDRLTPGTSQTVQGTLRANETVTYIVSGEQGQTLTARLPGEGVLMTVLGPDQQPLPEAERVNSWQSTLQFTGDYFIQLSPVQGIDQSNYTLDLTLEAAAEPSPEPSPEPTTPAEPVIQEQTIQFGEGETGTEISDRVDASTIRRYYVNAQAGQQLNAEVVSGAATIAISAPDGTLIPDAEGLASWQSQLNESGDYIIDVSAPDAVDFTLRVSVTDSQ